VRAQPPPAERTAARIPATPEAPTQARELVTGALRGAGWPRRDVLDAAIAVDEAVQNAVEHGSRPDAPVDVLVEVEDDGAEIVVRDRGRPGASPPAGPPRRPDHDEIRGRGRAIMETVADEVRWSDREGGTEVRLRLRPTGGEAGAGG
jgi:anti-sigma regulatory factor (Ser/Thr protein kinase)